MILLRINKDCLAERFDIDEQVIVSPPGEITVYYKDIPLFGWSFQSGSLEILCPEDFTGDIIEAIDRTGLYPLEFEFNSQGTGVYEGIHDNVKTLETPYKLKINNFVAWFDGICSSLGNKIYLVPDTNFLRRHYYNNFLREVLSHSKLIYATRIVIPRLCILEIENKYNRSSTSKPGKKKDELPEPFIEYNVGKERRLGLSSIKEVISIKKNGGGTNPSIDNSLIESFSRASGEKYADHWIRREILEFISSVTDRLTRDDQGETVTEKSGIIFLTCDIMNSLVAVSENINTLYILRREPDKLYVPSSKDFTNLVYNTAIQFGECTCHIKYFQDEKFRIIGMWEGKTTYDWLTDRLLIDENKVVPRPP